MKIEHLTRKDYLTINPYSGINAIKKQLLEQAAIVVQDKEQFYGVITANDIIRNPKTLTIDCLTIKTLIDCESSIEQTLLLMNQSRTDVLPVGKHEKILGLVFKNDLYNYVADYNLELETKIKQRTQELENAVATKDMLFSIIAHDLRSPFNTILGFSDLLSKNIREYDIEKAESQITNIHLQAKKAYNLLDNLLIWAKSQTGQLAFAPICCDISIICLEVIELLKETAQRKDISLNSFHSNETNTWADKNMVETILRNVVSNAIKFTEPNGKIDIYSTPNKNFIEITVSDNGIGVNELDKSKLFNFKIIKNQTGTANEKGTGLGLMICKNLVEINGGKIWIENKASKGTDLKFSLPKYDVKFITKQ